jgi:signal transduction histidine kinase
MGLGLALIKELVEACGGKVSVKSTVGEGSTFTLTLPIAQDAGPTAGAQDPVCVDSLGNPAQ